MSKVVWRNVTRVVKFLYGSVQYNQLLWKFLLRGSSGIAATAAFRSTFVVCVSNKATWNLLDAAFDTQFAVVKHVMTMYGWFLKCNFSFWEARFVANIG